MNGLDEAPARISQPISDAFAVGSAVSSEALPDLPSPAASVMSGSWPTATAPPGAAPGISLLSRVVARKGEKASGASGPSVGLPAAAGGLAGHLESVREQLDGLDGAIRDSLHNEAARCAVLCIGRNGRLVLARAYTLAEVGHPITTPRHRFRWASVAKLLQAMRAPCTGPTLRPGSRARCSTPTSSLKPSAPRSRPTQAPTPSAGSRRSPCATCSTSALAGRAIAASARATSSTTGCTTRPKCSS
ncbi:MAG: serine hydrolase [Polyangiaceae bacterium]|nr:serine hydrolase [Polyangiaceae bacterium]